MSLIDAGMNRSRTVISLLVFLLIAGLVSFVNIPKESDPDINIPIMYVSMHHDGISPEDAERLLVRPMEKELRGIEGVKEMRSTAYEGGGNVVLEFEAGFDADIALTDVREAVDIAKAELPTDTDEPSVNEVNLSEFPVLAVSLSGTLPERAMLRLAEGLKDEIESIPSVLEVTISGKREEVVEILLSPNLIENYNLDAIHILDTVSRSNQLIAAGAMDTGAGRFAIKVPGLLEGLEDIMSLPLKTEGDAVIQLKDVAEVRKTFKDATTFARVNGEPAMVLEVSKRTGENIIGTINEVRAITETIAAYWPDTVQVSFSQDKSNDIRRMLDDLQNNITSAILLVMIVAVAALGLRAGILVGVAIPGSFLTAILVLYAIGFTVNMVVLFSLILAVGMLVDGAIVVTEYADRKLSEGLSKRDAYAMAAKRMSWPIIASTATTLAAFMPLIFWPGIVGEFMKFLPITLTFTLLASLAMALLFIPILGTHLAGITGFILGIAMSAIAGMLAYNLVPLPDPSFSSILGILVAIGAAYPAMRIGGYLGRLLDRRSDASSSSALSGSAGESNEEQDTEKSLSNVGGLTGAYIWLLKKALRFPGTVLTLAFASLIASWMAYGTFGKGVEFFPDVEPERSIVNVHARGNMSAYEIDQLVGQVEQQILAIQDERQEFRSIYMRSGILESRDDQAEDIVGQITLEYVEWDERRTSREIRRDIEERTAHLAGLWIETTNEEAGPPSGKPIHIEISSANPEQLAPLVEVIRDKLDNTDGLVDIEDSRAIPGIEWELDVDRAQAAKFGADISLVGSFIQMVTKGLKISDYRPDSSDDEVDIVARYPEDFRTIHELDRVRVTTENGAVPVSNFVTRTAQEKSGLLRRTDANRIMFIKADIAEGVLADTKVQELSAWAESLDIPLGVSVKFRGENEDQQEAQQFLMKAFGVALFIMAIILVTQFNSFYSAFLILTAVIMSTVGVMLGLIIIEQPFGIVMSGVGVIALAGIVVNNNIVLIDTYDFLSKREKSAYLAILKTGAQRLRPVMLTTITTILGLMPMVFQMNIDFFSRDITVGAPSTQWWVQLSTAIAFGLSFSTILTLLVTPAALMLRANLSNWRLNRKSRGKAKKEETMAPPSDPALPSPAE